MQHQHRQQQRQRGASASTWAAPLLWLLAAWHARVVVPLVNWAGTDNLTNLTVTVNIPAVKPGMKATLATGGKVTQLPGGSPKGGVSYQLDLGIADALILR